MFISTENEEQISRPLENGVESNLDSPDGLLSASEMPESPLFPAVSTDVNVVPEHEKNELETKIVNLEGKIIWALIQNVCCW